MKQAATVIKKAFDCVTKKFNKDQSLYSLCAEIFWSQEFPGRCGAWHSLTEDKLIYIRCSRGDNVIDSSSTVAERCHMKTNFMNWTLYRWTEGCCFRLFAKTLYLVTKLLSHQSCSRFWALKQHSHPLQWKAVKALLLSEFNELAIFK